jgi:HEAT repeat protein
VRDTAAELLALSGGNQAGELILIEGALKDSNPIIRASAVHGLYYVGAKTIRSVLLAMKDKDVSVRREACLSLMKFSTADVCAVLSRRSNAHRSGVITVINEIRTLLGNAKEDLGMFV